MPNQAHFIAVIESIFISGILMEYTLLSVPYDDPRVLKDLHLLAFAPMTGEAYPFGQGLLPVYQMALKDIGRSDLLNGYRLVAHLEDSQVIILILIMSCQGLSSLK